VDKLSTFWYTTHNPTRYKKIVKLHQSTVGYLIVTLNHI